MCGSPLHLVGLFWNFGGVAGGAGSSRTGLCVKPAAARAGLSQSGQGSRTASAGMAQRGHTAAEWCLIDSSCHVCMNSGVGVMTAALAGIS